jgi:hypothetical protein
VGLGFGVQGHCRPNRWRAPVPWRRHCNPIELCQGWLNRRGHISDSNDGCRGLQPLEFGHFPMTAERSNRIAQVL